MEKMYVHLGFYLKSLKVTENRKPPEERRDVPTIGELAMAIGVNPDRIYRLTHGRTRSLNLDIAAGIIIEMCKRGFDTDISDILKFNLPGESKPKRPPPPLTRRQRLKYPGDEFVKAYAEGSDNGTSWADASPKQPEMLPEVTEVMRMLTNFPDAIQKDAAEALKGQLELVQKTLSFHDQ